MTLASKTYRNPVSLPEMLMESEAMGNSAPFELEVAKIVDGKLAFDKQSGFSRALEQGFFFVEIPAEIDTTAGDLFVSHFHEPKSGDALDKFRGYREVTVPGEHQGYFDREHDQWENFYLEKKNWSLLPLSVQELGGKMAHLGLTILRNVLQYIEIKKDEWPAVSGGLSAGLGHQMLGFNHFRANKNVRGCKFHRDSGWVTILRSTEPGLLALIDGKLGAVNPRPNHFIVNFGSSIEVLTEKLAQPVRANIHGVVRTEQRLRQKNRTSYTVFLDSALDGHIYRYEHGTPKIIQSVAEFARQEVARAYDDNSIEL